MALTSTLRPLLVLSNFLGLGPFVTWKNGLLLPKPKGTVNCLMAFALLCVVQYLVFADLSRSAVCSTSPTADFLDTLGFASLCFGTFLAHTWMGASLRLLYNKLLHLHKFTPYSQRGIVCDLIVCVVYETIFSLATINGVGDGSMKDKLLSYLALETIAYAVLEVYNYMIFLQYFYVVQGCLKAFMRTNEKAERLTQKINAYPKRMHFGWVSRELRSLAREHSEHVHLCHCVNQLFGTQNLLSICFIFLEVTYALYNGVTAVVERDGTDELISRLIFNVVLWAGYFIYKLIVILSICTETASESLKTIEIIHDAALATDDTMISEEIEHFSLQLLHLKADFNALGFFAMDMSLMRSIVGSVTGYLIILMQFSYSSQSVSESYHNSSCPNN